MNEAHGEVGIGRAGVESPRLSYLPGLDGLRALAVLSVLLYHAEMPWMAGGFLGVEVFFVLSGYLITSLLLGEWRQNGSINLRAFWLRRARRLLPALFLLLAGTLTFAVLFLPDEVSRLRGDALAATGYVTNWYLVFSQQSYFEAMSRPSLLQHLWSLAVEEQFYLLWPPLIVVGLRILRTRRARLLVVLVGAAASAGLMALLYQPDADASRIYYGTDTRAAGLLIGSALAFVWLPKHGSAMPAQRRIGGVLVDLAGLFALGGLAITLLQLDETQPFLYQGGFALTALLTVAVIWVSSHPSAFVLSKLLGQPVLRWVGLRSYGIYLWHWPVYSVTRPQLDVPLEGTSLLVLRLVLTLALAEFSYRCVEMPVRSGALGHSWRALREARGRRRKWLGARWVGATVSCLMLGLFLGIALIGAKPPAVPDYLSAPDVAAVISPSTDTSRDPATKFAAVAPPESIVHVSSSVATPDGREVAHLAVTGLHIVYQPIAQSDVPPTIAPPVSPGDVSVAPEQAPPTGTAPPVYTPVPTLTPEPPAPTQVLQAPAAQAPAPPTQQVAPPAPTSQPVTFVYGTVPPAKAGRITAIGDSVMLGAVKELKRVLGNIDIDAAKSRQVSAGIKVLKALNKSGRLGDVVIIHLGNNGYFTAKQFDELMASAGSQRTVIFLNNKVPRRWEVPNNAVIADGVKRYPNAIIIDWRSAIMSQPGLLGKDGIHIGAGGARLYTQLIVTVLGK
jgi:peptidoglycan/LPS O-acetylase OafA/YrhL